MSAPSNAPIGAFEYKSHTGEWVLAPAGQTMDMYGFIATKDGYRFRPNTYLKDADGGWWLEGDEGWTRDGHKFFVALENGCFMAKCHEWTQPLYHIAKSATHTPPKNKYKRWTGEYDSCYGYPTEKRYIEVENERVGEAERRETGRRAGYVDETEAWPWSCNKPVGRRQGPQDRRTGEGE